MGWRVSYYQAVKDEPLRLEKEIDESTGEVVSEYYEINGQMIINNEGTEIWLYDITEEQKSNSELFEKLADDPDCDYYKVTKTGLELIISKYRERIIKMFKGMLDKDPEFGTTDQYAKRKLWMWEHGLELNMKYDKSLGVTTSSFWEYTVFNLVYLYRNFDFENYNLVLYGG